MNHAAGFFDTRQHPLAFELDRQQPGADICALQGHNETRHHYGVMYSYGVSRQERTFCI